jgi:hypothetical protein
MKTAKEMRELATKVKNEKICCNKTLLAKMLKKIESTAKKGEFRCFISEYTKPFNVVDDVCNKLRELGYNVSHYKKGSCVAAVGREDDELYSYVEISW